MQYVGINEKQNLALWWKYRIWNKMWKRAYLNNRLCMKEYRQLVKRIEFQDTRNLFTDGQWNNKHYAGKLSDNKTSEMFSSAVPLISDGNLWSQHERGEWYKTERQAVWVDSGRVSRLLKGNGVHKEIKSNDLNKCSSETFKFIYNSKNQST